MSERRKILIVDDDANTRTTLVDLLTEDGYEIMTAADGKEALDKVHEEKPDVALIDVRLPDLDGYEVCRRIKESDNSTTKVILHTAYADAINAAEARAAKADDFLGKTSDFSSMRDAIKNLVEQRVRSVDAC